VTSRFRAFKPNARSSFIWVGLKKTKILILHALPPWSSFSGFVNWLILVRFEKFKGMRFLETKTSACYSLGQKTTKWGIARYDSFCLLVHWNLCLEIKLIYMDMFLYCWFVLFLPLSVALVTSFFCCGGHCILSITGRSGVLWIYQRPQLGINLVHIIHCVLYYVYILSLNWHQLLPFTFILLVDIIFFLESAVTTYIL
jgi:hypothetical protein